MSLKMGIAPGAGVRYSNRRHKASLVGPVWSGRFPVKEEMHGFKSRTRRGQKHRPESVLRVRLSGLGEKAQARVQGEVAESGLRHRPAKAAQGNTCHEFESRLLREVPGANGDGYFISPINRNGSSIGRAASFV